MGKLCSNFDWPVVHVVTHGLVKKWCSPCIVCSGEAMVWVKSGVASAAMATPSAAPLKCIFLGYPYPLVYRKLGISPLYFLTLLIPATAFQSHDPVQGYVILAAGHTMPDCVTLPPHN